MGIPAVPWVCLRCQIPRAAFLVTILQTTFSNAFSLMKIDEFRLQLHSNLFL